MHEACGVFGIYAPGEDIARITYFALFALQHRGQESAGIATSDGYHINIHTGEGLVSHAFSESDISQLKGHMAIGHNRYSTKGSSRLQNAQPIIVGHGDDTLVLAHNGNISNAEALHEELAGQGYEFTTGTDTEVIGKLILSAPYSNWIERISYAAGRLQGAYSVTMMTHDKLFAMRDPMGMRPLCLGRLNNHGSVIASESCALNHIGAQFIREVAPGELIVVDGEGLTSYKLREPQPALCTFEYIYFSRPDSVINGRLLYSTRQEMGARLAEEYPVDGDLVVGVPDSATPAAIGYSAKSGIPLADGLIKNRYIGRTFIQPNQRLRDLGVKLKFNPLQALIEGKRIILVDDSIVRGTTTPKVINLLRSAGVKEVHMRICAPPIRYPCFFGVDMANRWELIAAYKSIGEVRDYIGADSLGYLSVEGLVGAIGIPREELCLSCFTGSYPLPVQLEMDKLSLEALSGHKELQAI